MVEEGPSQEFEAAGSKFGELADGQRAVLVASAFLASEAVAYFERKVSFYATAR